MVSAARALGVTIYDLECIILSLTGRGFLPSLRPFLKQFVCFGPDEVSEEAGITTCRRGFAHRCFFALG